MASRRVVAIGLIAASLLQPTPRAQAYDVEVDSETTFRAYEVRTPTSTVYWTRRRLIQNLSLRLTQPLSDAEGAPPPRLHAQLSLRMNQEFGDSCLLDESVCFDVTDQQARGGYQPLARDGLLDMPLGYIETRDLPLGSQARVGRQLHWDTIGFARHDGATVRVEPTRWFAAEALGGALVRDSSVAGSDAFAPAGFPRLDLTTDERESTLFVEQPVTTWLAGGSVEVGERRILRGTLSVRDLSEGRGVVQRSAALALVSEPLTPLRLEAHGVQDLVDPRLVDGQTAAQLSFGPSTSRAELTRHVPRFDQGSIWAFFAVAPTWQLSLSETVRWSAELSSGLTVQGRRTELGGADRDQDDAGVSGWVDLRVSRTTVALSGFGWGGGLGPLWGADLWGERRVLRWLTLRAGVSVWRISDPVRDALDGVSVSETLGASIPVESEASVRAELTHAHSGPVGSRFSGLASLHLGAWR